jgi:hypothetical protein
LGIYSSLCGEFQISLTRAHILVLIYTHQTMRAGETGDGKEDHVPPAAGSDVSGRTSRSQTVLASGVRRTGQDRGQLGYFEVGRREARMGKATGADGAETRRRRACRWAAQGRRNPSATRQNLFLSILDYRQGWTCLLRSVSERNGMTYG